MVKDKRSRALYHVMHVKGNLHTSIGLRREDEGHIPCCVLVVQVSHLLCVRTRG